MAFVDDIDGTSADETVTFGFDGSSYEIDLASHNAAKLRAGLQAWAEAGRPVTGRRSRRVSGPDGLRPDLGREESAAIREWGRRHGYEVAGRGRLPVALVDAFNKANRIQQTA